MINDPVERWRLKIGDSSFEVYKVHWNRFLSIMKVKPTELVKLPKEQIHDMAVEYYNILEKKGYSNASCSLGYSTIRSFCSHNSINLGRMSKKFHPKTQYEQGFLVTQQQVFQLAEAAPSFAGKIAIGICFQAGQRDGIPTGLKFKHIETKNWEAAKVVVFAVPALLFNKNGKNVNKWQIKYRFAVLNDVKRLILNHVREREAMGEKITPESWLIRSRRSSKEVVPLAKGHINVIVKDAAEKIGIQRYTQTNRGNRKALVHAHIGRVYFKTQMRQAGVDPELRDFMMGHKTKYDGAYDKFSEREIVTAFEIARTRLALVPQPVSDLERRKQNILDNAAMFMPPEKLEQLKSMLMHAKSEEAFEMVLDNFKNGREKLESVR